MANVIGKALGILSHTFSITNDAGDKVQLVIKLDCRTATDADVKGWVTSNRIIAGQRPWRSLSKDELTALNGTTFIAQNIGQKVKSRAEQVQSHINAGLPLKLAEFAVDNPEQFQAVMDKVELPKGEDKPKQ